MPQIPSIHTMIAQCHGLVGTQDLDSWQTKFIDDMHYRITRIPGFAMSDKQYDKLKEIWEEHFAA